MDILAFKSSPIICILFSEHCFTHANFYTPLPIKRQTLNIPSLSSVKVLYILYHIIQTSKSLLPSLSFICRLDGRMNGLDSYDPQSSSSWLLHLYTQDCPACPTINTTGATSSRASYRERAWPYWW